LKRSAAVCSVLALVVLPMLVASAAMPLATASRVQTGLMIHAINPVGASTNWGGYAVTGATNSITLATASWKVPAVTCPSTGSTYSSYWLGMDGFTSTTVEQTGTDSDCISGTATYSAWYEFFPAVSVTIPTIHVTPGDIMVGVVAFSNGQFTLAIKDKTTGQVFTKTGTVSGALRDSAEFIVEAPEICSLISGCQLVALSNFGQVGFGQGNTGVSLTCGLVNGGVAGSITKIPAQVNYIAMVSQSGTTLKALPSAPTSGGTSFTVAWDSTGP